MHVIYLHKIFHLCSTHCIRFSDDKCNRNQSEQRNTRNLTSNLFFTADSSRKYYEQCKPATTVSMPGRVEMPQHYSWIFIHICTVRVDNAAINTIQDACCSSICYSSSSSSSAADLSDMDTFSC